MGQKRLTFLQVLFWIVSRSKNSEAGAKVKYKAGYLKKKKKV